MYFYRKHVTIHVVFWAAISIISWRVLQWIHCTTVCEELYNDFIVTLMKSVTMNSLYNSSWVLQWLVLLGDFSSKLTWFSSKFTSLSQRLQVRYVSYFRKKICLWGDLNPGLQGGSQMTNPLDQLNLSWRVKYYCPIYMKATLSYYCSVRKWPLELPESLSWDVCYKIGMPFPNYLWTCVS